MAINLILIEGYCDISSDHITSPPKTLCWCCILEDKRAKKDKGLEKEAFGNHRSQRGKDYKDEEDDVVFVLDAEMKESEVKIEATTCW